MTPPAKRVFPTADSLFIRSDRRRTPCNLLHRAIAHFRDDGLYVQRVSIYELPSRAVINLSPRLKAAPKMLAIIHALKSKIERGRAQYVLFVTVRCLEDALGEYEVEFSTESNKLFWDENGAENILTLEKANQIVAGMFQSIPDVERLE